MINNFLAFKLLSIFGCWFPIEEINSKVLRYFKYVLRCIYSALVIINLFLLFNLEVTYMIIESKSSIGSALNVVILNTALLFCFFKIKILIIDRNKFLLLDSQLSDPLMTPKSNDEILIHKICEKNTRLITALVAIIHQVNVIFLCIVPLISPEYGQFPISHWMPFEVNQSNFWKIYIWHVVSLLYGGGINGCSDCIFVDCIEHLWSKLKILSYRLKLMPDVIISARKRNMKNRDILMIEKKMLRPLFYQHQLIFK